MSITSFLIRIIFIFIPGLICYFLFSQLTGRRAKEHWQNFLVILTFSVLCYFSYFVLVTMLNSLIKLLNPSSRGIELFFIKSIFDEKVPLNWNEIILVSIIGFAMSYVFALYYNKNIVTVLGILVKVTTRYGDEDVWNFFHNVVPDIEWVVVRDHKLDLLYYGWIDAYSDSGENRELFLKEASVHDNETGDFLYKVESMYISRDRFDLTIEVPLKGLKAPKEEKDE